MTTLFALHGKRTAQYACIFIGDVVSHHNKLRDVLAESGRRAHLGVHVERGSNVTLNHSHTRPADLLVPNWVLGKPAAFYLSVTSPLNPTIILEASVTTGAAARTTEQRKHCSNDAKCDELSCVCVPLVVEILWCLGKGGFGVYLSANCTFSHLLLKGNVSGSY